MAHGHLGCAPAGVRSQFNRFASSPLPHGLLPRPLIAKVYQTTFRKSRGRFQDRVVEALRSHHGVLVCDFVGNSRSSINIRLEVISILLPIRGQGEQGLVRVRRTETAFRFYQTPASEIASSGIQREAVRGTIVTI